MALSKEEMKRLHDSGKMPSWAYYAQNGESAQYNYAEQKKAFKEKFVPQIFIDKKQAETALKETVEKAVDELLKGLTLD